MAVVIPAPGEIGAVARVLLDLAGPDRAGEVEIRTLGGTMILVPDDVAEAYAAGLADPAPAEPNAPKRRARRGSEQ